tara:strand:+ start:24810 stop:25157 length:348 start_codon:yes stop_codon:yes gene_type:complete
MVCFRKAEKENVGRPAYALWNTKKWKKEFQSQVTKAYGLLKKYSDKAIINALNSPRGKSIYSLRVKNLEYLIKDAQKRLDKMNPSVIDYNDNTQSKPPKPYGQESTINKLRKLDG